MLQNKMLIKLTTNYYKTIYIPIQYYSSAIKSPISETKLKGVNEIGILCIISAINTIASNTIQMCTPYLLLIVMHLVNFSTEHSVFQLT